MNSDGPLFKKLHKELITLICLFKQAWILFSAWLSVANAMAVLSSSLWQKGNAYGTVCWHCVLRPCNWAAPEPSVPQSVWADGLSVVLEGKASLGTWSDMGKCWSNISAFPFPEKWWSLYPERCLRTVEMWHLRTCLVGWCHTQGSQRSHQDKKQKWTDKMPFFLLGKNKAILQLPNN